MTRFGFGTSAIGLALCPFLTANPALCAATLQGGGTSALSLLSASNGFGQLLPHQIIELDSSGSPTNLILDVRSLDTLIEHARNGNGLLPSPSLPSQAILPNGAPGNHYLQISFAEGIDPASVFDFSPAALVNNSLSGLIDVVAQDPVTNQVIQIPGRVFVGGLSPGRIPQGGALPLLSLVRLDPAGGIQATGVDENQDGVPDGLGFPGTQGSFVGAESLVARGSIVFVPDADGDLSTHETLPAGMTITMRARPGLQGRNGATLRQRALLSTTVGSDDIPPNPTSPDLVSIGQAVIPVDGEVDVDSRTEIDVFFSEPIQVNNLGPLPGFLPLPGGHSLTYGEALAVVMPVNARPASIFALDHWILSPAMSFPGQGSSVSNCGDLSQVSLTLPPSGVQDLASNPNTLLTTSTFETGAGPGIVNAPVAPDAILVGRSSPASISVIDLNGFGASTGSPRFDPTGVNTVFADSNYPNDPNIQFGNVPLFPGTCTIDGGSAGPLTLTLDSNLDSALVRPPHIADTTDMVIGRSLDVVFNNASAPFGCQSQGGQACAADGLKLIRFDWIGNSVVPQGMGQFALPPGSGNLLSWAPHPNPPPLTFPPLCAAPSLFGIEPSSTDLNTTNLLGPGDPFGDPLASPPIPPSGTLGIAPNQFFEGPSLGQTSQQNCSPYMMRQQVGNFEYVLDRVRAELVVLNSNRQTVVDRIPMEGAGRLALSPQLDFLAVSQQSLNQVSFVDVQPNSGTFHQVVKVTTVGAGPLGIAWQPENEDILVCNELENSLSILSAFDLEERKRVTGFLNGGPFEVVALPRMDNFGFLRNVYFAWILQRDGSLAMFESGPDGPNGWGFDDVIGLAPATFRKPKALLPQQSTGLAQARVWVAHEGPIDLATGQAGPVGVGAISSVEIESALTGQLLLGMQTQPQFRSMQLGVLQSLGEPVLSGIPVDLAFDDMSNLSALPNKSNPFSAGTALLSNGRGMVRDTPGPSVLIAAKRPRFLLAAMRGGAQSALGLVDVIDMFSSNPGPIDINPFKPGRQSISVPGVRILVDAFRQ